MICLLPNALEFCSHIIYCLIISLSILKNFFSFPSGTHSPGFLPLWMLISLCCGSFCPDSPLLYLVGRWLVLRSSFEKTSPVVPITINAPEISNIYPNPNVCSELQQKFSTLNSTSPPRLTRRLKKSKCPNPKLSLHHTHTHNKTTLFPAPCLQKCHYC